MREDEFEQDNSDLYGGFAWADRWQTVFFIFDVLVMLTSFFCYVCLLRAMARHSIKENSIIYLFLVFFYFTSLVDFALILEFYMSIYVHQYKSNDTCRFISFVTTGNRLLQVFAVLALLYLTLAMMEINLAKVEAIARKFLPLLFLGLIVLEIIFALPPSLNVKGSSHGRHCLYVDDDFNTVRLTGWLYSVLLPYFIPLLLAIYPMVKIFLKIKNGAGGCASERERSQYQIVLSISLGYFFFHFLYYLMWLGRQIEAVTLEKTKFRQLLGLHVWYIARPLFSCINLGWHIISPLSPFIFDLDLLEEVPGPWVSKNRMMLHSRRQEDVQELQDRSSCYSVQEEVLEDEEVDGAAVSAAQVVKMHKDDQHQWTEIHNPLPMPSMDDDSHYHQIPL